MYSFFGDLLRDSRRTVAAPVGLGFRNGNISLLSSIANRDHQIFLAVATRCASATTHDSRGPRPRTGAAEAAACGAPPADVTPPVEVPSASSPTEVVSYYSMYTVQ